MDCFAALAMTWLALSIPHRLHIVVLAKARTHNPGHRLWREGMAQHFLIDGPRRMGPGFRQDDEKYSRDTRCPSFASTFALHRRGRREDRMRAAPAVSCARSHRNTHTSIQVQRRTPGLPCAMVLRLIRALPGETNSFATIASRIS